MRSRDDFPDIDTTVASVARMYDYALGGTDNYAVDRMAMDGAEDMMPGAFAQARGNRRFLERVVRYLAGEAGITQFIDFGSGLPTQDNVHRVAQDARPGARVIYVDNDPVVLRHQKTGALLSEDNSTAFILDDLRRTGAIFGHDDTARLIDFAQPVGLLYLSVLHLVPDADDPHGLVRSAVDRLAPGSYLAISHGSADDPAVLAELNAFFNERTGGRFGRFREKAKIAAFFDGLELIEPGLTNVTEWRGSGEPLETSAFLYGGVGRKPA